MKERTVLKRLPLMRYFILDPIPLVLVEIGLFVDEVYAEEVVDKGELLLVAKST